MQALLRETIDAKKLLVRLYDRPLHPELFDIHSRRQIESMRYNVDFWVTSCSHLISLRTENGCLTEFLGTPRHGLPESGELDSFPLKGPHYKIAEHADIRYQFEFGIESVSENVYGYIIGELKRSAQRQKQIFLTFGENDETPAFCYASVWRTINKLQVSVCHGYPRDMKVLRTLSLFELAD